MLEKLKKEIEEGEFEVTAMLTRLDILEEEKAITPAQKEALIQKALRRAAAQHKKDIQKCLRGLEGQK